MTVDVNLFVMASHIIEPIDQFPNMRAWIFQYEDTAHIETGRGETFNQVSSDRGEYFVTVHDNV